MPSDQQTQPQPQGKSSRVWIILAIILGLLLVLGILTKLINATFVGVALATAAVAWLINEYLKRGVKEDKWKIAEKIADKEWQHNGRILDTGADNCRVDRIASDEYAVYFFREACAFKYGKNGVFGMDVKSLAMMKAETDKSEIAKTIALQTHRQAMMEKMMEKYGLQEETI